MKRLRCKEQSAKDIAAESVHKAPSRATVPATAAEKRWWHRVVCPRLTVWLTLPWTNPCTGSCGQDCSAWGRNSKESEIHRLSRLLRLGHRRVHIIGCICIAVSLKAKCMGLNCQSDLIGFFTAIGSQVGKKTSTNQKTTQKPPKNWEKQHHSLKSQDKASKFNSDNLFTWSRHYLPLHLSCHLYSPFPLFPSAFRLFFFSCPCKAQGIFSINPFSVTGFTDLKLISIY